MSRIIVCSLIYVRKKTEGRNLIQKGISHIKWLERMFLTKCIKQLTRLYSFRNIFPCINAANFSTSELMSVAETANFVVIEDFVSLQTQKLNSHKSEKQILFIII